MTQMKAKMTKKRISISGIITWLCWVFVCGFIGMSLPRTINLFNGLNENALYGILASYMVACMLFWVIIRKWDFYTTRRGVIDILKESMEYHQERRNKRRTKK